MSVVAGCGSGFAPESSLAAHLRRAGWLTSAEIAATLGVHHTTAKRFACEGTPTDWDFSPLALRPGLLLGEAWMPTDDYSAAVAGSPRPPARSTSPPAAFRWA